MADYIIPDQAEARVAMEKFNRVLGRGLRPQIVPKQVSKTAKLKKAA